MFRFTGSKMLFILLMLGAFLFLSPGVFTANSVASATSTPPSDSDRGGGGGYATTSPGGGGGGGGVSCTITSTPPSAPANVRLTATSTPFRLTASSTPYYRTIVNLEWTDTSCNETGFLIEKSTDYWNFFTIGRLGAHNGSSTMTFTDTANHVGGYRYFYYIRAFNSYGTSSAWATIVIPRTATILKNRFLK